MVEEIFAISCLTLIEACLNSRPITPLSSNPDDLSPLTPGHFLIGTALTAPAESDVTEINIHRLDQWQKIQQVRQHFWKRWSREYIVELQQRSKWATSTRPAAVGDIVIVHEDNIPPLCWSLGRIEAVQPGRDGKSDVHAAEVDLDVKLLVDVHAAEVDLVVKLLVDDVHAA
ncbi:hypothetical protein GEV33_002453 [Tenebrio molitor]|uniref:DUF5641 domain-containing protein n=1 Tax=Tenebrio molitor TaxID=7067 RepID=A0A8J6HVJ9_TENMO|nr:hypothetical protein GEV33_002453 [Tenebrio molitor]